jgi:hypothetical protein
MTPMTDGTVPPEAPETRHRACWYGRRTPELPEHLTLQTIEDGMLLFCGHPMWFPIVGYEFDVRSCTACEYFRPRSSKP